MGIDFFGPIQPGQQFPTSASRANAIAGAVNKLRNPSGPPNGGPNNGGFQWQGVTITVVNSRTDPIKQGQAVVIKAASVANTSAFWRETPFTTMSGSGYSAGNTGTWGIAVQEIPGTNLGTQFAGQVLVCGLVCTKVIKMPGDDNLVDLGAFRGKADVGAEKHSEKLYTSAAGCATLIDYPSNAAVGDENKAIIYVHGHRIVEPRCKIELNDDLKRTGAGSGVNAKVLGHRWTLVGSDYRANGFANNSTGRRASPRVIYVYGDELPTGRIAASGSTGWADACPYTGDWILTSLNGCPAVDE